MAYMYIFGAFIVSIEIGCYLVVMVLIEDLKQQVGSINKLAKVKMNQPSILRSLNDSIQFHTRVKQLRALLLNLKPEKNPINQFYFFT